MNVKLDPDFFKQLKKLDIRIRKSFIEKIAIFQEDPLDSQLNNHKLREPYEGLRSIDITNDYRAVYEEMTIGKDSVAYFSLLGTHEELYKKHKKLIES